MGEIETLYIITQVKISLLVSLEHPKLETVVRNCYQSKDICVKAIQHLNSTRLQKFEKSEFAVSLHIK